MAEELLIDYLCFHHPTKRPGQLKISRKSIDLILYDFRAGDGSAYRKPKSVQLQSAEYATLFDVRTGAAGWSSSTDVISLNGVSARRAIIGGREWVDEDRVAAIEFKLSDTAAMFSYHEQQRLSYKSTSSTKGRMIEIYRFDREEIIKINCGKYKISIGLKPNIYTYSHDIIGEKHTNIIIEFEDPVGLNEAYHVMFHLEIFCMLSIGRPCRRYGTTVSTEPQRHQRKESNCFSIYDIHYDQAFESKIYDDSLFTCSTALDRRRLSRALFAWMARRDQWNVTYLHIHTFIQDSRHYDRNRLIRAMAWFESLPDFQGQAAFSNKKLSALQDAVAALPEFEVLGLSRGRLATLAELRRPPLIDRLDRAFKQMRRKYTKEVFTSELFTFCEIAKKYRDEAAHGASGESLDNFSKLAMASSAMETLALACTLSALGVSVARMKRIAYWAAGHRFARFAGYAVSARNNKPTGTGPNATSPAGDK